MVWVSFMHRTKYYYDTFVSERIMTEYRGSRVRAPLILHLAIRKR
jgi:hypothetical protein